MKDKPAAFRVAVIAHAVGMNRRAVLRALRAVPPAGIVEARGNEAAVYTVDSLPAGILRKLDERAGPLGLDREGVLKNAEARKPWQPSVRWSQANPTAQAKARKMREAFRAVFERHNARNPLPYGELRARGLEDYERAFGTRITARHWDRLYGRFIARAGALEDFDRLELYLDERIAANTPPPPRQFDTAPIDMAADLIDDPARPAPREKGHLWATLFDTFQVLCKSGEKPSRAKRLILAHALHRVPGLSKNQVAAAEAFRAKIKAFEEGKDPFKDRRAGRSGAKPRIEVDEDLLLARMLRNRGRALSSWQELWDEGKLPGAAYEFGSRENVPNRIEASVRAEYNRLSPHAIGPKYAKLHGAKTVRTWEGIPAGAESQSDDMTGNHYFWFPTPAGRYEYDDMRFDVLRGQFLPWIDTRTGYIRSFILLARESYNQLDIARSWRNDHDKNGGLPPRMCLEGGTWEKSLLIAGRNDELGMKERIYGLRDLGIEVVHVRDPSAKIVERVFGDLQNYMDKVRGYAGRDERRDCPESTKKHLATVKARKCHPAELLLSFEEMVAAYEDACNRYNDTPSNGKRLKGLSPREAFARWQDPESPPIYLEGSFRWPLATHWRVVKIGPQGLSINIGKQTYVYRSPATGARRGERVMARFEIDNPSFITFSDLDCNNHQFALQATEVPAIGAGRETLAQAYREIAAHEAPSRTRFGNLKKVYPEEFAQTRRRIVSDRKSYENAVAIETCRREAKEAGKKEKRKADRANRLRRELHAPANLDPRRIDSQTEGLADVAAFFKQTDTEPEPRK